MKIIVKVSYRFFVKYDDENERSLMFNNFDLDLDDGLPVMLDALKDNFIDTCERLAETLKSEFEIYTERLFNMLGRK